MIDRVRVNEANRLRHERPQRQVVKRAVWLLLAIRRCNSPQFKHSSAVAGPSFPIWFEAHRLPEWLGRLRRDLDLEQRFTAGDRTFKHEVGHSPANAPSL
jgi:hypothetical protein